jgi:hypothetical protein
MPKGAAVFNFRYKMKYPGRGAYHFPSGPSHDKRSRIPVTLVMGGMRKHPITCFYTSVNYIMY